MLFPEGISTLQQMSLTWHYLKGLLKVMQLITWVVITAQLLRYLKWFIIDSRVLESGEHLHTQPRTLRQGPVQAPQSLGILRSPPDATALCGTQHRVQCHHFEETSPSSRHCGQPWLFGVPNPAVVDDLGKRYSPQPGEDPHRSGGAWQEGNSREELLETDSKTAPCCLTEGTIVHNDSDMWWQQGGKRGVRSEEVKASLGKGERKVFSLSVLVFAFLLSKTQISN